MANPFSKLRRPGALARGNPERTCLIEQVAAGGSQTDALARAVEQACADRVLQRLDLSGERRLRDRKPLGRAPEVLPLQVAGGAQLVN